jgi:hypothetical protein
MTPTQVEVARSRGRPCISLEEEFARPVILRVVAGGDGYVPDLRDAVITLGKEGNVKGATAFA